MSLAPSPVSGSLAAVSESNDAEAGAIYAVYKAEWKAPEREAPITLVEWFANIW